MPGRRVEVRLEGGGDAAALAEAAVLGGRHHRRARARRGGRGGARSAGRAAAVEEPRPPSRAPQLLAQEAEGRDAVARRPRAAPPSPAGGAVKGRPSGPRHRAASPGAIAARAARARAHRLHEEREGLLAPASTERIEKGRRRGGSAETPGLDHHELAGARLARRLGVAEGQQDVGAPERLAADEGGDPVGGHRGDHTRARRRASTAAAAIGYAVVRGERKTLASAAVAAAIVRDRASCTLALYLNPGLVLRREAPALGLSLFLPWTAAGTLALALVAAAATALRWWPRPFRPVSPAGRSSPRSPSSPSPAAAALYWHNLLAYRHALPLADAARPRRLRRSW